MPMLMFRMEQRIRIVNTEDDKLRRRKGTVVKVNDDGSALVRLDGDRGTRVTGTTVWPEDCEPI